jgi:hypothetical protein
VLDMPEATYNQPEFSVNSGLMVPPDEDAR